MSNYSYSYDVKACPACEFDFNMPNAIEITVVIADVPREVNTQLRGDGSLVDVENLVANGYHGGTRCARCGESLEQHETQETT
jgi:hypothetical protein